MAFHQKHFAGSATAETLLEDEIWNFGVLLLQLSEVHWVAFLNL